MKKSIIGFGIVSVAAFVAGCSSSVPYYPYYPTPEMQPSPVAPSAPVESASTAPASRPDIQPVSADRTDIFQRVDESGGVAQEDPNLFPALSEIIKDTMPSASSGSALAVRFVNTETGLRVSAGLSSEEGFVPLGDGPGRTLAVMSSAAGESITLVTTWMRPGHFECGKDFALEFAPPGTLAVDAAAAWSDNPGGSCEIDVWAGENPGDLQGKLSGTLVTNDGATRYEIESGYFYARRPLASASGTYGAAPAAKRPAFTR